MFDRELSLAVKTRMKGHIRTSECWANSLRCITFDPSLNDCLYVEGYTVVDRHDGHRPMVIEHGWIETLDGKVIDPTFAGELFSIQYFSGLKFDRKEVKKLLLKAKKTPFYASIYHYDSPEYTAAFDEAMAFFRGQS